MTHQVTRRQAIKITSAAGAMSAIAGIASAEQSPVSSPPALKPSTRPADEPMDNAAEQRDRDFVVQAGMTEAEAECWETIARAAGQFFALPVLHPMDAQEMASAIHVVQNKLLSRPTYRKYLELAKAASEKRQP